MSQQQGSDMAAPEPLANRDVANPPRGIERTETMNDAELNKAVPTKLTKGTHEN